MEMCCSCKSHQRYDQRDPRVTIIGPGRTYNHTVPEPVDSSALRVVLKPWRCNKTGSLAGAYFCCPMLDRKRCLTDPLRRIIAEGFIAKPVKHLSPGMQASHAKYHLSRPLSDACTEDVIRCNKVTTVVIFGCSGVCAVGAVGQSGCPRVFCVKSMASTCYSLEAGPACTSRCDVALQDMKRRMCRGTMTDSTIRLSGGLQGGLLWGLHRSACKLPHAEVHKYGIATIP